MKNSIIKGSLFGMIYQIIVVFLSFSLRSILINNLGKDYVGLITLFTSIFAILSSVDGGMGSALFIKIHRPLWKDDKEEVKRIYNLIRIIYFIRASIMFIGGIAVMFFLPSLVDTDITSQTIFGAYILFMVLNCFSTGIIYSAFMVETIQKRYKLSIMQILVSILFYILNIVLLIQFSNPYLYIIFLLGIPVVVNLYCRSYIIKELPYLSLVKWNFKSIEKKELFDMGKLAFHSMSDNVVLNSDSLIITTFINFATLSLYANFKMIIINIQSLVMQILFTIKDPIRKKMSIASSDEVDYWLGMLLRIYYMIANFVCISLIVLLNPFIDLWLGDSFVIDQLPIILVVLSLFLTIMEYPIIDAYYFEECYKKDFKTPIIEMLIYFIFSIAFSFLFGLSGVFIGLLLYHLYKIWKRSKVYYLKNGHSNSKYVKEIGLKTIYFIINLLLVLGIDTVLASSVSNIYILFVLRLLVCVIVPNVISLILCHKDIKILIRIFKRQM